MATPSITGLPTSQAETDAVTRKLFSGITVTDNAGGSGNVSVIIKLTSGGVASDADGLLTGSGLTKTGAGTYTLVSTSPSAMTNELRNLVFTPTAHQVAVGSTVTTGISVAATDTSTTTATGNVVVTAVNTAPTVQGLNSQNVSDESGPTAPFSSVTITDPDKNASTSATITLTSGGVATDANGLLSGAGLTKSGVGVYTLSATTPANLSAEVAALNFTPTAHQVAPGDTVQTTFGFAVAEGSAVTNASNTIAVTAATDTPVIDGTVTTDQPTTDEASITPLSAVAITDVDAGQTETVTVGLSDPANGTLSDPNATTDGGSYDSGGGVYTVTGSASEVSAALDGLVFTPTIHQVAPGQAVTTTLTITDTNTAGVQVSDSNTTIVATAQDTAPTIGGLPPAEGVDDNATINPFSTVTVTDPDAGASNSATITLTNGGTATDADGLLAGEGLTKTGAGTYSLAATDPTSLSSELRGLTFTPTAHQVTPGDTVATSFNVTAAEGSASTSASTVVTATAQAPCYLAGTRIMTDRGEVAVEQLAIGDRLVTLSGQELPIKWIGQRSYAGLLTVANTKVQPVLIRQGALAAGVPTRDLYVSPDHALYLRNVLIPAALLINGSTIVRAEGIDPVCYFHVELEAHAVIFAEGAAAESFVDCDSRLMFQNAGAFAARYPDDVRRSWTFCAPRMEEGFTLQLVHRELAERAGGPIKDQVEPLQDGPLIGCLDAVTRQSITGWAFQSDHTSVPAQMELLDGDALIMRFVADTYRADLEKASIGNGCAAFMLRLPKRLSPDQPHNIRVRRVSDKAGLSPVFIPPSADLDEWRAAIVQAARSSVLAAATSEELGAVLGDLIREAAAVRRAQTTLQANDRHLPRMEQRRALVIDNCLPVGNRDGGSNAILSHVRALQRLGYQVEFIASHGLAAMGPEAEILRACGVIVHGIPAVGSVEEVLQQAKDVYNLIYLHRLSNAEAYASLARRHHPRARILFSVADLQSLRDGRRTVIEAMPHLSAESEGVKQRELLAMRLVDVVVTHSSFEAELLSKIAPWANVHVVTWDVLPTGYAQDSARRRDIGFVGHYGHAPNLDAAHWLVTEIMPLVWKRDPSIRCLLAGSAMPPGLAKWAERDARIEILGEIATLSDIFDRVRVTVAPLGYGAGIKSKVLDSFAAGVPCVMSPIAAEGIPLSPALKELVGSTAEQMSEAICLLHNEPAVHMACASAGQRLIREYFNADRLDEAMSAVIAQGTPQIREGVSNITVLRRG